MSQNITKNTPIHSNEVHVRQIFSIETPSSATHVQQARGRPKA